MLRIVTRESCVLGAISICSAALCIFFLIPLTLAFFLKGLLMITPVDMPYPRTYLVCSELVDLGSLAVSSLIMGMVVGWCLKKREVVGALLSSILVTFGWLLLMVMPGVLALVSLAGTEPSAYHGLLSDPEQAQFFVMRLFSTVVLAPATIVGVALVGAWVVVRNRHRQRRA
jgi:hypothetical protein